MLYHTLLSFKVNNYLLYIFVLTAEKFTNLHTKVNALFGSQV